MKKIISNVKNTAENMSFKAVCKMSETRAILNSKSGEAYLDLVIIS